MRSPGQTLRQVRHERSSQQSALPSPDRPAASLIHSPLPGLVVARRSRRENRRVVQRELPTGTVTFLFTDVEGSTRLLEEFGDGVRSALAEHRRVLREAFARHGGVEVDTQGDAFFVAFPPAPDASRPRPKEGRRWPPGRSTCGWSAHGHAVVGEEAMSASTCIGRLASRRPRTAGRCSSRRRLPTSGTGAARSRRAPPEGPAARSASTSWGRRVPAVEELYRTNLPVPATPFLGREQELPEVSACSTGRVC